MQRERVAQPSRGVEPDPEPEVLRPEVIAEEHAVARYRRVPPPTIFQLAIRGAQDPEEIARRMGSFLDSFDRLWLRRIQPEWLVEFTDREGNPVYRPTLQAAIEAAKIWGISILDFAPLHESGPRKGNPNPLRSELDSGAIMYEVWARGFVGLTGEETDWVRAARHSNEPFIGRATRIRDGERVDPDAVEMDLTTATISLARKKVYLIGAGKTMLTRAQLTGAGASEEWFRRVRKGAGHGKAAERREGTEADATEKATPPMVKRNWALFIDWGAAHQIGEARTKAYLRECLKEAGVEKQEDMTRGQMRRLWSRIEAETKAAKDGHPVAGVAEGTVGNVSS